MIYIARQPIFNLVKDIVAYELLYRDAESQTANIQEADVATASVLVTSTLVASLDQLTGGKPAFINFTKNLIDNGTAFMFSKNYIVVELLEDIIPDETFIKNLKELRENGYTLVLDDFVSSYPYQEIVELVDIIKVDFILTTPAEQIDIIKKYARPGLKFLAEKIESVEEFDRAKASGYDYFQGYYFAKPSVLKYKDISSIGTSYFEMLAVLDSSNPSYEKLATIAERDVALSFKLFKYVNSPIFGGVETISTVKLALVRLGFDNIRKWLYLTFLRYMSSGQSQELLCISLQRAKLLELIAKEGVLSGRESECFLIGLFSMLDVLMSKPIEDILSELPLPDESKAAIIHKDNALGKPLMLALAYEKGDWKSVDSLCYDLKVKPKRLMKLYMDSLQWATDTIEFTN